MKKLVCIALCVLMLLAFVGCQTEKKVDLAFPTEQVAFGMTLPEFAAAIGAEDVKGNPGQLSYDKIGMEKPELLGLPLMKDDGGEYYDVYCYFFDAFGAQDRAGTFKQLQAPVLCEDMAKYLTGLFGEPEDAANLCGKIWSCKSESGEVLYQVYFMDTQQDVDGLRAYHLMLCGA